MDQISSLSKSQAKWEWQSNANPWNPQEPPQWIFYGPSETLLLENAYHQKLKEVDLGEYIISLEKNLQVKKDNPHHQRPIKRTEEFYVIPEEEKEANEDEEEEKTRCERFFGAEIPKTYNNAFGSVEEFLAFFGKRGPEIESFVRLYNELERCQDLDLLDEQIIPMIINAIKMEAVKATQENKEETLAKLLKLFAEPFDNMEIFYKSILKAYTENGFLYQNLNKYLRDESWAQLDNLLPYGFALCKAFIYFKVHGNFPEKLKLFRGASLDAISLGTYEAKTGSNFSWYGVTSTSTEQRVALRFAKEEENKIQVIFMIEIPEQKGSSVINIAPYSQLPGEKEVILAPGSIFEIANLSLKPKKGIPWIHLRLVTKIKSLADQGQIMHGVIQKQMEKGEIAPLEGKELIEALEYYRNNQSLKEMSFSLWRFDEKIFDKLTLKDCKFIQLK